MRIHRSSRGRAGFTLLELAAAGLLLGIILGAAAIVTTSGSKAARQAQVQLDVNQRARRALDRMDQELTGAGSGQLVPDPGPFGASSFTFRRAAGVDGAGALQWSEMCSLSLLLDAGETDNGIDDDGDGSIDERELVLTRDVGGPGQNQVVLCHDVRELLAGETANGIDDNGNGLIDEPGFFAIRNGDLLELSLSLEERVPGVRGASATVATSMRLEN